MLDEQIDIKSREYDDFKRLQGELTSIETHGRNIPLENDL